ncbi:hypothetical protein imdm_417 [gamma proteobacterium IMCC2047]|nr:hypothetical protein imdm_417 [gamma proteobacterium IMCC2047]
MTIKNGNLKKLPPVIFFSLIPGLLSSSLLAKDWKVEPTVKVATIYSDNIELEANAESDLVLEVSPGVSVSREGRRLTVNLDYNLQNLTYADNGDLDSSNHRLSASANSELLAETLFLDLQSSISQQLTDRRASASSDGIAGSGNLSDVTSYSISPYWQQRLGDVADFELRYTFDRVTSDDSVGSGDDSDSNGVSFDMQNGPATGRINWTISHQSEQIRYDDGGKSDTELTSARLGYQLTRTLNAFVSRTEEDNEFSGNRGNVEPDDSTSGVGVTWTPSQDFSFTIAHNKRLDPRPNEDENFLSGDLFWAPTARTDISLGYGSRFFGKTYNGSINHKTRWTRWNLSYNEGVSDFRSLFIDEVAVCPVTAVSASECRVLLPGEVAQPGEVPFSALSGGPSIFRGSISDDTFINETARASVSIVGAQNTITFSLTDTKRTFVADNNTEEDSSVDVSWTHQLAARTNSRLTIGHTKEQFDNSEEDDFMRYAWRITRQIADSSVFYVEFQANDRDSDVASREYDENRLTVSFQKFF